MTHHVRPLSARMRKASSSCSAFISEAGRSFKLRCCEKLCDLGERAADVLLTDRRERVPAWEPADHVVEAHGRIADDGPRRVEEGARVSDRGERRAAAGGRA